MAAGSYGIHPSYMRVHHLQATTSTSSVNDALCDSSTIVTNSIDSANIEKSDHSAAIYSPTIPIGSDSSFELREIEYATRLATIKNKVITLLPKIEISGNHRNTFPNLTFTLVEFGEYLQMQLRAILGDDTRIWIVGRAARNILAGVHYNDIDLCIYSWNAILNKECQILGKNNGIFHPVFKDIQRTIDHFLIKQLQKADPVAHRVLLNTSSMNYLIRSCYLTNRKIFDGAEGCLYSLGGQIDLKIIFALDKPKSVTDVDGFHFCLNSPQTIMQCSKGKVWCQNTAARDLALSRVIDFRFQVEDVNAIRDLMFRLVLESRQGFELNADNITSGLKQLASDYPIQDRFTPVFCRHQKNHCRDRISRMIDFLSWITYTKNDFSLVKMIASAWLDGTTQLDLSPNIEIPIAILLKKHPETANLFLTFLRGHLLLKFSNEGDRSFSAYQHPSLKTDSSVRTHFCFSIEDKPQYLFTGLTPVQIASDFLIYSRQFQKFVQEHGGMTQLAGLFSLLGIDCQSLHVEQSSTEIARLFLMKFIKSPIANVLSVQYKNTLPLAPFYKLLKQHIKDREDIVLLQQNFAKEDLKRWLEANQHQHPDLEELKDFILQSNLDQTKFLWIPNSLSKLLDDSRLHICKTDLAFRNNITPVILQLIENISRTPTINIIQACYSLYIILDKEELLSIADKNNLMKKLFDAYHELKLPSNFNASWIYQLFNHTFTYTFTNSIEVNPQKISTYLSALRKLIDLRNDEMLLNSFHHLEKFLIWETSHRDELITIIIELIRCASIKQSPILSGQICYFFDILSRRHRTLMEAVLNRLGAPTQQLVVNGIKQLVIVHSGNPFKLLAYRTMNELIAFGYTDDGRLIDLFTQVLDYPHESLELAEILAETTITLLNRDKLRKEQQRQLILLAFHLLKTTKTNSAHLKSSDEIGCQLIETIFKKLPDDNEFKFAQQWLLENIAKCLLKRNIGKVKKWLPIYIKAYEVLSKTTGEELERFQFINPTNFSENRKLVLSKFMMIVTNQAHRLLTLDVFVKLQKSFTMIDKEEFKENDGKKEISKSIAEFSISDKQAFELSLIKQINNIISHCATPSQQTIVDLIFTFLVNDLRLYQRNFSSMPLVDTGLSLQSALENLFDAFIKSPQISSSKHAYQLLFQIKSCGFIKTHRFEELFCIPLINKLNHALNHLNYLEHLFRIISKNESSYYDGLDSKSFNILLTAYKNILENTTVIDLDRETTYLRLLIGKLNHENASLLVQLGSLLIPNCLQSNHERYFGIAVSILHMLNQKLIQINLMEHIYQHLSLDVMYILVISKLPVSWKTGTHDDELRNLFTDIGDTHLLEKVSIHLIDILYKSGNSFLRKEAIKIIPRSVQCIEVQELAFNRYQKKLEDGGNKCLRFTRASASEKANLFFDLQESSEFIKREWNIMKEVFTIQKNRKLLNKNAIEILTNTQERSDLEFACQIVIEEHSDPHVNNEAVSSTAIPERFLSTKDFSQLIKGFITLPICHYTPSITNQLMQVSELYFNHQFPYLNDRTNVLEYINLVLQFLDKLSKLDGIRFQSQSVKILSCILIHFKLVDHLPTQELLGTIILRTMSKLIEIKDSKTLNTLACDVFNYLDEHLRTLNINTNTEARKWNEKLRKSSLDCIAKSLWLEFKGVMHKGTYDLEAHKIMTRLLQYLTDLIPWFHRHYPQDMNDILDVLTAVIIQYDDNVIPLAHLFIKNYQLRFWDLIEQEKDSSKITTKLHEHKGITTSGNTAPLSIKEKLAEINKSILLKLKMQMEATPEIAILINKYILALYQFSVGKSDRWGHFLGMHIKTSINLLENDLNRYLVNREESLNSFISHIVSLDTVISSTSPNKEIFFYYHKFEIFIIKMLLYPAILKITRSHTLHLQASRRNKICFSTIAKEFNNHPFVKTSTCILKQSIDDLGLEEDQNSILDWAKDTVKQSVEYFAYILGSENFIYYTKRALLLFISHIKNSMKLERDHLLDKPINYLLSKKRIELTHLIISFLNMMESQKNNSLTKRKLKLEGLTSQLVSLLTMNSRENPLKIQSTHSSIDPNELKICDSTATSSTTTSDENRRYCVVMIEKLNEIYRLIEAV